MQPPLQRTPVQLSVGNGSCAGRFSYAFTQAEMAQQSFAPGMRFNGQFWMRDPTSTDGTGIALTDALEVFVHP